MGRQRGQVPALRRGRALAAGSFGAKATQARLHPLASSPEPEPALQHWDNLPACPSREAEAIKGQARWRVPSPGPRLWACSVRINCWMTEWTRGSVQGATWEPSIGLRGESCPLPGARPARHPPGLQLTPGPAWQLGSGSRARALTHLAKLTSHILLRSPTFCQARAGTPRGGGAGLGHPKGHILNFGGPERER